LEISGSSGDINFFIRSDGKPLSESGNADLDQGKIQRAFGLYTNPLEGLFGYHAKHNRDSNVENKN
jgi:hypothetical protein